MYKNLLDYLVACKKAYYSGSPLISDSQYDALEEACKEDLSVGTQRGRSKHWYRMYSLQKLYVGEGEKPEGVYFVTPKLDGAALALRYLDGNFVSAVTRGDGIYGEDVTNLFNKVNLDKVNIQSYIPLVGAIQINGELAAKSSIPNARNYASGAMHLKSEVDFGERELTFFAYDIQETPMQSYLGTLCYLEDMGFNTVRSTEVAEYPQDGKVFRLDCNKTYANLGYTNKHPRGAYALKTRSSGVVTTLIGVEWNTGKSGKVTPVAILESVDIDGATVSRATLNNPGFIEALALRIGDLVLVERAGGIIPRIIKKAE